MLYEHVDTAVIDGESLPWIPFTPYAENVLLKYFKLDPIRGEWIVMMKSPIDMQLPKHHHTGTVMVYTIEGQWKYKEHDWIAGPGSIVYETAGSTHTPEVVSTGNARRLCAHAGSGQWRSRVSGRATTTSSRSKTGSPGSSAISPIASSMTSHRKTSRHSTDLVPGELRHPSIQGGAGTVT